MIWPGLGVAYRTRSSRARRSALLLPIIVLAHLAVSVIVLRAPGGEVPAAAGSAIMVVAVAAPAAPPEALPPPPAAEILPQVEVPTVEVEPEAPVAVAAAAAGCALTEEVQTALRQSNVIPGAIAGIPAAARSVANSLMLWDGAWARPAALGGDAVLAPIQQVVKARILAAPADCRSMPITGPRLMLVPDGTGSVVLAFGSGVWNWGQVLG